MSAIYGHVNWDRKPISPEIKSSFQKHLKHRGEDAHQIHEDEGLILGFLLNKTFRNDQLCRQPLRYQNHIIVGDIRLDNRSELAGKLGINREELMLMQDALLIAKAFMKWDLSCAQHLIGDFSCVIWDQHRRRLYAIRDQTGMKALFYYQTQDSFIFASEIKAIVEHPDVEKLFNEERMIYHLLGINTEEDVVAETFFKNVYQLFGGHYLLKDHKSTSTSKYWKLDRQKEIRYKHFEEYAEHFQTILGEAIACRMATDFDVGIALSGGLDSSSVAVIAAQQLAKEQKLLYATSSVMPTEGDFLEDDERPYIEAVLDQEENILIDYVFNKEQYEAYPEYEQAIGKAYTPSYWAYYIDEAFYRSLKSQNSNVRLMLTGVLGDAVVSYSGNGLEAHLLRTGAWAELFRYYANLKNHSVIKHFMHKAIIPQVPLSIRRKIRPKNYNVKRPDTVHPSWLQHTKYRVKTHDYYYSDPSVNIHANIAEIINNQFWPTVFPDMETRSSYHNITYVNPLIDIRVMEFMMALPVSQLAPYGVKRGFIRYAMEGLLPEKIQWRHSKGIFAPDFSRRLVKNKALIKSKLESCQNELTNRFIDYEVLINSLNQMELVRDLYQQNRVEKNNDYSVTLGFSAAMFMKHFFD
ncbi:MAG: asparagine synthase-related protein [Cytophagales bacterium]|nr:asparagine synthase-related protein [Cytophagales bacterium]